MTAHSEVDEASAGQILPDAVASRNGVVPGLSSSRK